MNTKLSHCALAAIICLSWLLMTLYPPWVYVANSGNGHLAVVTSLGFAPINDPPRVKTMETYVGIDMVRLLLQCVTSAVVLTGLGRLLTVLAPKSLLSSRALESRVYKGSFLALSLLFVGLAGNSLNQQVLWPNDATAATTVEPVTQVVYAVKDVAPHTVLTSDMLQEKNIAFSRTPQDAAAKVSEVVDRVTAAPICAGSLVTEKDLAKLPRANRQR